MGTTRLARGCVDIEYPNPVRFSRLRAGSDFQITCSTSTCRPAIPPVRAFLANVGRRGAEAPTMDGKIPAFGRAHVVGWIGDFRHLAHLTCWRVRLKHQRTQCPKRRPRGICEDAPEHDDAGRQLRHAPGPVRHRNRGARPPKTFAGKVMRAAKAGHGAQAFGRSRSTAGRSTVGRGRRTTLSLASRSPSRRVVVMTRIVRYRGGRFRSAPLSKHVASLRREGVTRDGADAGMFDATSYDVDTKAFVQRCEEDRHHFRFTVSRVDAVRMADLRAFARELMGRRGTRPRHEARLGGSRSLEHRQSPHPCARPRSPRRRKGPGQ